jgi:hypothetical protein
MAAKREPGCECDQPIQCVASSAARVPTTSLPLTTSAKESAMIRHQRIVNNSHDSHKLFVVV